MTADGRGPRGAPTDGRPDALTHYGPKQPIRLLLPALPPAPRPRAVDGNVVVGIHPRHIGHSDPDELHRQFAIDLNA